MGRFTGILAACLLLVACGDSDNSSTSSANSENKVASAPAEARKDGLYGDLIYGSADAPVEVIEYASLTCPGCAYFDSAVFPKLKEKYIDTGKVKFVFRNFIRDQVDLAAASASRCSNEEVAKKLTHNFFARQRDWLAGNDPLNGLAGIARRAGISRTKFDRCVGNKDMHKHLVEMTQGGVKGYGVNATPTLIVDGKKIDSNQLEDIAKEIEEALN